MENNNLYSITDPQRDDRIPTFFEIFFDKSKPDTYNKIYQSAIKANFTNEEANLVALKSWFLQGIGNKRREIMVDKSERILNEEFLDMDCTVTKFEKDENGYSVPIQVKDPQLLALKLKAAMYATERLDKDNYSPRTEHKEDVTVNIFRTLDQINKGVFQEGKPIEIAYNPINNE